MIEGDGGQGEIARDKIPRPHSIRIAGGVYSLRS